MQSLREKIKLTLDQNLKSRDEIATSTVRLILAAIKDHDIQYRTKKKGDSISDEEILNLLLNMIKQRKESVKIYSEAWRDDLKKREEKEIEIINSFLPHQITSNELDNIFIHMVSPFHYFITVLYNTVNKKYLEMLHTLGLVLLLSLMIFATYNDVLRIIK